MAVISTVFVTVTALLITVNAADVLPAATVTDAGTVAAAVFELIRFTFVPPDGALVASVTIPVELFMPPITVVGRSVTLMPSTTKVVAVVAVPPGLTIVMTPVVALGGTTAVIVLSLTTLKEADAPLNSTDVMPVKCFPVTVTVVPAGPFFGVKSVMVGAAIPTIT